MRHTLSRPDALRHWLDTLPTWITPFETMKLEEQLTDDAFVVRAELPGIDPDKDVDVWIADGMLHVKAERTMEHEEHDEGSFRSEFSYGSFHRAVSLPHDVATDEVKATYKDGVLEVRLPRTAVTPAINKVTIDRA